MFCSAVIGFFEEKKGKKRKFENNYHLCLRRKIGGK